MIAPRAKRLFVFFLLAATLAGCDTFSSDDSGPDWVGDWRLMENFGGEPPDRDTYFSYSKDRLTILVDDPISGCNVFTREIVEVNGNEIRVEIGSNRLETQRLTISDDTLNVRILRSNNPNLNDETLVAEPAADRPREALGCRESAATGSGVPSYRQLD